uniref:Uncharacterized protein n=1 Tax=Peronospora matthiolae TaxID=2874970 RepID=A0AAV1UBQ1_9STRA
MEGEVFLTLSIGSGPSPERHPRLRTRQLTEAKHDTTAAAVQLFAEVLARKIPYSVVQVTAVPPNHTKPRQQRRLPPRVTRTQREHRLDEALDDLQATQQAPPSDRKAARKARRRVGRVRASMDQLYLCRDFSKDEAKCVANIWTVPQRRLLVSSTQPPATLVGKISTVIFWALVRPQLP